MKIGYTGAYCTANFGDWAILINNIIDINAEKNVVFTYSAIFPHSALNVYCSEKNVTCLEVKTVSVDNTDRPLTPFECLSYVTNYDEIADAIKDLDVLCVSGGGYFDDNWCGRTEKFIKMVAPAIIAKQLGKRLFLQRMESDQFVTQRKQCAFCLGIWTVQNLL